MLAALVPEGPVHKNERFTMGVSRYCELLSIRRRFPLIYNQCSERFPMPMAVVQIPFEKFLTRVGALFGIALVCSLGVPCAAEDARVHVTPRIVPIRKIEAAAAIRVDVKL